jgi:hypothetical protein
VCFAASMLYMSTNRKKGHICVFERKNEIKGKIAKKKNKSKYRTKLYLFFK